jgi:hypothetical protein
VRRGGPGGKDDGERDKRERAHEAAGTHHDRHTGVSANVSG